MSDLDVTEPQAGGDLSDDQGPSADQVIEENKRLRSQVANLEENTRRANSVVDISRRIYSAPGGKAIFEKAKKAMAEGKELKFTEKQEEALEEATGVAGITAEQVQQIVQQGLAQHRDQMDVRDRSRSSINDLHERGKKELEGYDGMYKTDAFNRMVSHTLEALAPGEDAQGRQVAPALPTPEGVDPYWYAIEHAHKMLTVGAKTPPKGKNNEAQRRAAIAGQQTVPAGGPEENSDPDSPEMAWAKAPKSTTVGKTFS
jgi:hypothetical protein